IDPLGGSYYVEALTAKLAEEAEALIAEVDALGGMTAAVARGMPKRLIEEAAAAKQARIDRGEDVVIGVNKYPVSEHAPIDTLEVDNHRVREGQIARLAAVRAERDEARCTAALAKLAEGARSKANLLALAIEAARADATLGEIAAALEEVFGRHGTTPTPVRGIYSRSYADDARRGRLSAGVAALARRLGRAARLLGAKMGPGGHARRAKVLARAAAPTRFAVVPAAVIRTPREAADGGLHDEVQPVGARSLADG